MPEIIILEDGTEREVPTEEELEDERFRSSERKKQREEVKKENQKLKEEFSKLSNKDLNFGRLKNETKKTKEELAKQAEELDEARKTFVERQTNEYLEEALSSLVGENEDERKKVLHYYNNELSTKAITKNEIMNKVKKAYQLTIKPEEYNQVNRAVNYTGRENVGRNNKAESDISKEMRQKIFRISNEKAKKYDTNNWQPKF